MKSRIVMTSRFVPYQQIDIIVDYEAGSL
jgi:hypothetical protein